MEDAGIGCDGHADAFGCAAIGSACAALVGQVGGKLGKFFFVAREAAIAFAFVQGAVWALFVDAVGCVLHECFGGGVGTLDVCLVAYDAFVKDAHAHAAKYEQQG